MKGMLFKIMTGTVLMAAVATTSQAQSLNVAGNTTGCFGDGCTAKKNSANGSGVSFAGTNPFNWTAVAGTPQTVTLGTFNFKGFSCAGLLGLCSGEDDFKLRTMFTAPSTVPQGGSFFADINAGFALGVGGGYVDFDNGAKMFNVDGGTLSLKVNDTPVGLFSGKYDVTGQLTYTTTTTPEPGSMALLGTGLIGLVPMVRRRRK